MTLLLGVQKHCAKAHGSSGLPENWQAAGQARRGMVRQSASGEVRAITRLHGEEL